MMKRALTIITLMAMCATLLAETPKVGDGKGQVVLSWNDFVKITGYDPASKGSQVVTIPWKDLQEMLGVQVKGVKGATVDLPWRDFQALLKWSVENKTVKKEEIPLPADYIIMSSTYKGTLAEDGAAFTLTLKLDILKKTGWKHIAVLPKNVAVTGVQAPEGKKVYLNATQSSYELLTEEAGEMEVAINFSVLPSKSGGVNRVSFGRMIRGSTVLDLHVASQDVDVKVSGAQSLKVVSDDGKKTRVAAVLPADVAVSVTWERAIKKAPAAPTMLYAETRTLVSVADGLLLCHEMVNYNILHTAVRELKLTVPAKASVLSVSGANVQDWRVDKSGHLSVVFSREVIGSTMLRIAYEQTTAEGASAPIVRTVGTVRERGFVGVVALANVELEAGEVSGATAIDVRRLPGEIASMTSQPVLLAFRYVGEKVSIPLTIKKHGEVSVLVTVADSVLYTIMQLNDGRRMTRAVFSVRNNRNQFLRMTMPAGAEIWSTAVGGKNVTPAKDEAGNVLIPLVRSATTASELAAFPVELVYVETPDKVAPAKGKLRVNLPVLHDPVIHVMCNYYLPSEGKYTVSSGLWGSKSGFSGPLQVVGNFAAMAATGGGRVVPMDAAGNAQAFQQQMDKQMTQRAQAAGATPIRVKLPVNGKLYRLEKILALKKDQLYFEVQYSEWEVAR